MSAELGLAAYEGSIESLRILSGIVDTVRQVVRFKSTCREIGKIATTLKGVLEKNQATLKTQRTFGELNSMLTDIRNFVARCTKELNVAQRAWDVVWRKRLPKMMAELQSRTLYLIMETTAETQTALHNQKTAQGNLITTVNNTEALAKQLIDKDTEYATADDVAKILEVLNEQNTAATAKPLKPEVEFKAGDGRLEIIQVLSARPPRVLAELDRERVICIPSLTSAKFHDPRLPRHILIYSKISAMTLVQPFYGLADLGDPRYEHWALLQDLSPYRSLGQAIEAKTLPKTFMERLKIAYELSKSIAYLHSIQVLVKGMTDSNIILRSTVDGGFEPVLTDLENAREFLEQTGGKAYDLRYEAPEYIATSTHSVYTDVWCLGLLIMQILTQTFPWNLPQPVLKDDGEAAPLRDRIKRFDIQKEQGAFSMKGNALGPVGQIIRDCHAMKPTLRPTAAFVAEKLFDVMLCEVVEEPTPPAASQTAKAVVLLALEALESRIGETMPQTTPEHWACLEHAHSEGDPIASMLLGQAIWRELKPASKERIPVVLSRGRDTREIQRARIALPYLEFAVDAGVRGIAKDLQDIHSCLARAYRAVVMAESE